MWDQIAQLFESTVLDGALIAALPVALVAGVVSFASPCILPLLPGYVGYLGGMAGTSVGGATGVGPATGGATPGGGTGPLVGRPLRLGAAPTSAGALRERSAADSRAGSGRLLAGVLLFVAGFSTVFVLLSIAFSWAGAALAPWLDTVLRVMGVVVVLMGLAFLGHLPFLQRERRLHAAPRAGLWGAPVLGVVFGLGWAPCIGPTLAAVLTLALGGADPARGVALAVAYSVGLGLPFVAFTVAFSRSARALRFLRRHRRAIQRAGGGLLVLLGLALLTGVWTSVTTAVQGLVAGFETVV